ncbi:hypothetical protein Tco_1560552, partial [Tanacetum coccineum]
VDDEAVLKELGDRMERAATSASSLEAEQDSERQDDDLIFDTGVLDDVEMPVEAKVDGKDEQSTKKLDDSTAGEAVCNDPLRKGGQNVIIMVSYQSIIKA